MHCEHIVTEANANNVQRRKQKPVTREINQTKTTEEAVRNQTKRIIVFSQRNEAQRNATVKRNLLFRKFTVDEKRNSCECRLRDDNQQPQQQQQQNKVATEEEEILRRAKQKQKKNYPTKSTK